MGRFVGLVALSLCVLVPEVFAHNALFVGNSFVLSNQPHGVVGVLDSLQEAQGGFDNVTHKDVSKGGYTLELHAQDADGTQGDTTLRGYLQNGSPDGSAWRYVVLQEQSQTAGFHANDDPFGVAPLWDISFASAELLNGLIAAHGANTVFLMTWGYRLGGVMHTEMYPDYTTMQALLAEGYELYATLLSTVQRTVYVAPVGLAFQRVHDDIVASGGDPLSGDSLFSALYSGDDRHPGLAGSYLAGCVVYATLTGRDPRRLDWAPPGLEAPQRTALQEAAAAVTVDVAYAPRVLPWGEARRFPFVAAWSEWIDSGTNAASLSESDIRPTAVVDLIAAPVNSLVLGALGGQAGRVGVLDGGRLTVGGELLVGSFGRGQLDIYGGEVRASAVRLAVEEGSHGILNLSGGVLEADVLSRGAGAIDEPPLLVTGGELRATEVDAALQVASGTWTVLGEGVAHGALEVLEAGNLTLTLPGVAGVALDAQEGAQLAGTVIVSAPADGVLWSGTHTLVRAPELIADGLRVDLTALEGVEASWEVTALEEGPAALQVTISGGAIPVEADASEGAADDAAGVGPSPDEASTSPDPTQGSGGPEASAGSGGGSGGCGGGPVAPWRWGLALGLLGVLRWRARHRPTASQASTMRLG